MSRRARRLAIACALLALAPAASGAQGARITGVTTARLVELRPLVDDSVPLSAAFDSSGVGGDLRRTADGTIVRCAGAPIVCRYKRAGERASAFPVTQDLHVTAWGLGTGISAVADVRLRAVAGSRLLWPRADDGFDALTAYVELDRTRLRARAGRQWVASPLDTRNFDGVALQGRGARGLVVDAWGGWSLVPALNESHVSAEIAAVDELPPERRAWLVGAAARAATPLRGALAASYQREIRTDRAALYSERVAADWTGRLGGGGADASWTHDLAAGEVNELRLRVRMPPLRLGALRGVTLAAEGRRYRPFFELWSIWGAFSPVGFTEARADASWAGTRASAVAFGAYRDYRESDAGFPGGSLLGHGWRTGGDLAVRVAPAWVATGRYALDIGFGASGSDADLGVRWQGARGHSAGVHASAFQLIPELSVGTGLVWGGGVDAGVRVGPDTRIVADLALYRQGGR
ncbi:MAG: hypothetical protein ACXWZS_16980, partial [Gemmatirosa sp.]